MPPSGPGRAFPRTAVSSVRSEHLRLSCMSCPFRFFLSDRDGALGTEATATLVPCRSSNVICETRPGRPHRVVPIFCNLASATTQRSCPCRAFPLCSPPRRLGLVAAIELEESFTPKELRTAFLLAPHGLILATPRDLGKVNMDLSHTVETGILPHGSLSPRMLLLSSI